MGFIANFVRFLAVQKFKKSVNICQSYREFKGGNYISDSVDSHVDHTLTVNYDVNF